MKKSIGHSLKAGLAAAVLTLAVPGMSLADTLADALAGSYKHSGALEQNRALLRAADEDVAIGMAGLRPILNWSADVTHTYSNNFNGLFNSRTNTSDFSAGLAAELLLYDFGATRNAIEAAKETVLATRQALVSAEQSVLLAAVQAYMNVRRDSEFVALRQNNVRVITQELRAAKDRFEVGEITRTDVALAEARLASARSDLAAAEGSLMRSQEEYLASVGHRPGRLSASVSMPKLPATLEKAKAIALRSHPDIKRIQHQVSAADLIVLQAEASMKPTVKLSANYGITEYLDSSNYSRGGTVTLGASGPIYQGGAMAARLRKAAAQRDANRGNLHTARHIIGQNVGNAWSQLAVARASGEASDRQIRAARIAFRGVREEATLGSRTTLDVLDAEQELLNAQANRISAMIAEYTAAYTLLATMGHLTVDRLNLNVPRYDPTEYYNAVKNAPAFKSKQGQKLDRVLRSINKN